MTESDFVLEGIMTQLGEFGNYQLQQHLLHLIPPLLSGIHMLSVTFTAPVPESRCFIPQVDISNQSVLQLFHYIPHDENGIPDACHKFKSLDDLILKNETVSCEGQYFYNSTFYTTSRVIEWNLVCDKKWMHALLQVVYMMGFFCGSVIKGTLADRFGRKPVLLIAEAFQFVFGLVCAFMPNYYLYVIILFLYGSSGGSNTSFLMSMEVVGSSKRTICGVMWSICYSMGMMLASLWAWLIPNVQHLQIIFASHSILLIGHGFWVDESIRWLWGKGKKKEALQIVAKAVTKNGINCIKYEDQPTDGASKPTKCSEETRNTPKINGFFRYPNLCFRMVAMTYIWIANSLAYFGLIFNIGTLPGNPFFMNFLNALAEIPGLLIVILLLDRMGRRALGSVLLFMAGVTCIVFAFVTRGIFTTGLAMLAKMTATGSFAVYMNYAAEMFPTVIRNSMLGVFGMGAGAAAMLAPEVILLQSINPVLPSLVFGIVAITAAFLGLLLPETMKKTMPQTIEEGESFEKGDTAFRTLWNFYKAKLFCNDKL